MQNYLSDHGERNKRYKSQVNRLNVLMKPVSNYLSGVKGRIGAFMDNPLNALYNAYSNQIGVNLDLPISEYAAMAQNHQPGVINPNSPALQEAMSWLPGPSDNIVGLIGSVSKGKKDKWFHGTNSDIFDKFDISKARTGASERGSNLNLPDAVYLTDKNLHASAYGDNILEFSTDKKYKVFKPKKELEQWAKENNYKNFQEMIDDYYDGDAYAAADVDSILAREFRANPGGVIVDLTGYVDREYGDLGKILVTDEIEHLSPYNKHLNTNEK